MLVLTRKVGESVVISENIYCTVVDYRHGEIRLAFDAPQTIPIHRDEIQRRIYLKKGGIATTNPVKKAWLIA